MPHCITVMAQKHLPLKIICLLRCFYTTKYEFQINGIGTGLLGSLLPKGVADSCIVAIFIFISFRMLRHSRILRHIGRGSY